MCMQKCEDNVLPLFLEQSDTCDRFSTLIATLEKNTVSEENITGYEWYYIQIMNRSFQNCCISY